MPLGPPEIPTAGWIVDRRHFENTLNHDLSSLSLSSLHTADSRLSHASHGHQGNGHGHGHGQLHASNASGGSAGTSFLSYSSIEGGRAFGQGETAVMDFPSRDARGPEHGAHDAQAHASEWDRDADAFQAALGPSGTPRAARMNGGVRDRGVSGASAMSLAESPRSTEGHHVSAMTLADGVFRRVGAGAGADGDDADDASEFDPERSLGRLAGELGRTMGGGKGIAPRPASPFTHVLSPPRSPSPLPSHASKDTGLNLSYTLSRADALPSPPDSNRSDSHSPRPLNAAHNSKSTGFTSMARQLQADLAAPRQSVPAHIPAAPRRALSDSTTFNVIQPTPVKTGTSGKNAKSKSSGSTRAHVSAPTRGKRADLTGDITGMTGLMATPAKGGAFDTLGKNGHVGGDAGASIPQTLAMLNARLRALETEGSIARRRVRELEGELERARAEVHTAQQDGGARLQEVAGEKSALEALVASLRDHLARLTSELDTNKRLVTSLQADQAMRAAQPPTPARPGTATELELLRREIERLSSEIQRLSGIVEEGLQARRRGREDRTVRMESVVDAQEHTVGGRATRRAGERTTLIELDEEISAPAPATAPASAAQEQDALPSRLQQGVRASASTSPTLMPTSAAPPTREQTFTRRSPPPVDERAAREAREGDAAGSASSSSDKSRRRSHRPREGPASPFPSIRQEDEADFFAGEVDHETRAQDVQDVHEERRSATKRASKKGSSARADGTVFGTRVTGASAQADGLPPMPPNLQQLECAQAPQTVLSRVIAELEDDYAHYRSIYTELADQYRLMSAASAANKRQILAQHLKDVIDTLEHKSGQIHALYSLLSFQDRPDDGIGARARGRGAHEGAAKTPRDVMRMVRETLGEEAVARLEEDGVYAGARRRHCVV